MERPPFPRRAYAVLARVSSGCPPLPGRFLRVTHPSATLLAPEGTFAFDLHVLSMPPAFNLSQDQTLQFNHKSCLWQPILAQLRIFGIEDASLILMAVSNHQRSTHTNYLI